MKLVHPQANHDRPDWFSIVQNRQPYLNQLLPRRLIQLDAANPGLACHGHFVFGHAFVCPVFRLGVESDFGAIGTRNKYFRYGVVTLFLGLEIFR